MTLVALLDKSIQTNDVEDFILNHRSCNLRFLLTAPILCLLPFLLPPAQASESPREQSSQEKYFREAAGRGYFGFTTRYEEKDVGTGQMRVVEVHPGGPAEQAGIRIGDVISAVNGVTFSFLNDLDMIRRFDWVKPGDSVELQVHRGDRQFSRELTTTELPPERAVALARWLAKAEDWYENGGREACQARKAGKSDLQIFDEALDHGEVKLAISRSSAGDTKVIVENPTPEIQLIDVSKLPFFDILKNQISPGSDQKVRLFKDEKGRVILDFLDGK